MTKSAAAPLLSQRHRRAILISMMSAATAYLFAVIYAGYEQAWQAFKHIGVTGWLLLLSCSFSNYVLRFYRWQRYISHTGYTIPHRLHLLYYLAGFALTTTPGKAGETIRSLLLRPHGVRYPLSLAAFFVERFLDVIVICLLATLTVFAFADYTYFVVITSIIIVALLPLIRSQMFMRLLTQCSQWITSPRLQQLFKHLIDLFQTAQTFLSWRLINMGTLIGIMAWSIQGLAFYFIVSTLGLEIGLPVAMGIYAISLLAGAVSFIPGGVGTTEVVMGLLLAAVGADTTTAISAPLISRLSTLWFAVILGLLSSSWLSVHRPTAPQT